MKKQKKIVGIILSLICMLSTCMTVNVLAATYIEKDGIKAEIITDKSSYIVNEDIGIELNMTNGNAYSINNIQAKVTLPNGLTVKKGNLNNTINSLDVNDTKTISITAVKAYPVNKTNTDASKTNTTKSVKTGDDAALYFWAFVMIGSGTLLLILFRKKKKIGILFLLLGSMALGTVAASTNAEASATNKKLCS